MRRKVNFRTTNPQPTLSLRMFPMHLHPLRSAPPRTPSLASSRFRQPKRKPNHNDDEGCVIDVRASAGVELLHVIGPAEATVEYDAVDKEAESASNAAARTAEVAVAAPSSSSSSKRSSSGCVRVWCGWGGFACFVVTAGGCLTVSSSSSSSSAGTPPGENVNARGRGCWIYRSGLRSFGPRSLLVIFRL